MTTGDGGGAAAAAFYPCLPTCCMIGGYCGIDCLFSLFTETEKAASALNGRWFGGRVIKAEAYDELKFGAGDLSA